MDFLLNEDIGIEHNGLLCFSDRYYSSTTDNAIYYFEDNTTKSFKLSNTKYHACYGILLKSDDRYIPVMIRHGNTIFYNVLENKSEVMIKNKLIKKGYELIQTSELYKKLYQSVEIPTFKTIGERRIWTDNLIAQYNNRDIIKE